MLSVLVLLFASGMDVVCGWQPMPDGSASYECVVQIEPELIHKLDRGDIVPLSVDIPEHIRPIGRIRLTVGRGSLPQQTLVTEYYPENEALADAVPLKKSRQGLVETQYTSQNLAGNRYASQGETPDVLPAGNPFSGTQDALARSVQNGAQDARDSATQLGRDILPPDSGQRLGNAVQRRGQELSTQIGNRVQDVTDTARNDIAQYFDDDSAGQGRTPGLQGTSGQVLPPGAGRTDAEQILPENSLGSNNRRVGQPTGAEKARSWNQRQTNPQRTAPATTVQDQPGASDIKWPAIRPHDDQDSLNATAANGSTPDYRAGGSVVPPSGQNTSVDRRPPDRVAVADTRNGNSSPEQNADGDAELSFPDFSPSLGTERDDSITPTTATPRQSSVPQIRRGMSDSGSPNLADAGRTAQNPAAPESRPAGLSPQDGPLQGNRTQEDQAMGYSQNTANSPTNVFPLLLSWVLLSGSGAGNFYLLWSYLDVRNKYRDLVYDDSRKIRGRYEEVD